MKISIMGQVLDKSSKSAVKLFINLYMRAIRMFSFVLDVFLPVKNTYRENHKVVSTIRVIKDLVIEPVLSTQPIQDSESFRALLPYQHKLIKRLIWDFKYYLKPHAVSCFADIMYDELIADMSERIGTTPFSKPNLIIHCPSSTYFKGEKDFDHMKELLCEIEKRQNTPEPFFTACTHAVIPRANSTDSADSAEQTQVSPKAQHLSSRAERLILAQSRFILSKEFIKFLRNKSRVNDIRPTKHANYAHSSTPSEHKHTIYCIDDVTTTGATFQAVKNLIEQESKEKIKDSKINIKYIVKCIALSH